MRRIRLFTAAAAVCLGTGLSPAGVGLAHAAPGYQASVKPQDVSMWSRPGGQYRPKVWAACPNAKDLYAPGAEYRVKDNGIHIRHAPGGRVVAGIGKGRLFVSNWYVGYVGGYRCVVSRDGKNWLLGASVSGTSGWVRTDYLVFVKYLPRTFPN
jgi:hypothetical protein